MAGATTTLAEPLAEPIITPSPQDDLLLVIAGSLDDIEATRIATGNRLWDLKEKKGLASLPEAEALDTLLIDLTRLEHSQELALARVLRTHPLGAFVRSKPGLGEKQTARLLAAIGHPAWNFSANRPRRGPAELWALCGWAPGQKLQKGQKANWNPVAKKRSWLCAASCIKQAHSPYRKVYDDAREKYAEAVHTETCPRCGPAGAPALPGSPLSLGHQHARALRIVAKTILKDLFNEAKNDLPNGAVVTQAASEEE